MKSLLIVTGDFVKTGGMDRANFALAQAAATRGIDVHLVAFRVADELLRHRNVTFHRVPKPAGSYTLALPLLARAGRRVARDLSAGGGRVVVNGGSCLWSDVNWVHYVHAAYTPDVRAGLLRRLRSRWNHHHWLRDERRALGSAKIVIANSQRTRGDLINRLGVPEERVHTVYYGIDAELFRPASMEETRALRTKLSWEQDTPIVVFVGAMSDRRKGFDTVLQAWRELSAATWRGKLIVIGAGAEVPAWEKLVSRAGVSEQIQFLRFRADMADILRAADAIVAPARYEAYGLAVHEALCCGVPAIVSASAGVAERYSTELADLLIGDPSDAPALAAQMRRWSDKIEHYRSLVQPLADKLRQHSWDHMAGEIMEFMGLCEAALDFRAKPGTVSSSLSQNS